MPRSEDILSGLHAIANSYVIYAIIWHVIFYALIIAVALKWVPSYRLLGVLLSIPLFSVAAFAWVSGNPFNGTMFSIMAILILVFGIRASSLPISMSELPFIVIGIIMIVFGLLYPHFIETDSVVKYLYASPAGLIPCPTLSILIGFILLFNGFGSQPITMTFVVFGLFYGFFGAMKLHVHLDFVLIFGSLALLSKSILMLIR